MTQPLRTLAARLALVLAAAATLLGTGIGQANATSACRTDQAPTAGYGLIGAYVTTYSGVTARSSCATVNLIKPASNRVTLFGSINDTATDGKYAVVRYRINVNGTWGVWRTAATQTVSDQWINYTFPVTAVGTIYNTQVQACRWGSADGYTACGGVLQY
jgi:hypothetical protein